MTPPGSARRPRHATLDAWLAWFETLHPKKIDFSLDRVRQVLRALRIDRPSYRVITVGGTNGKGSCVAMLESIYLAAGYRVGAFTSPHLLRFNERIRIDGRDATDDQLIATFDLVDRALGSVTLSYFESSAVAALLAFARAEVDIAILEVGMGGRLDAVNAIDADAAMIVSVDLDHTDWLGPDREAIGREKAGIVRPGRPVVVADADPPQSLLDVIELVGAVGILVGRDYEVRADAERIEWCGDNGRVLELPWPPFGGKVQSGNAAACVAVVSSLGSILPVDDEAIVHGIAGARAAGRLDRRKLNDTEWLFDVAHNPAAAARLAEALAELPAVPRTVAVFGAMSDKQLDGVLAPFLPVVDAWHVAAVDSERTASASEISDVLYRLGTSAVERHPDIAAATLAAQAAGADRVLVFGSFYTAGPAIEALGLYSAPHSPSDPEVWTQA